MRGEDRVLKSLKAHARTASGLGELGDAVLGVCPGGTTATRVFCDGSETGNTNGGWSSTSTGLSRLVTDYVYRGDQLVGRQTTGEPWFHFGLDHLGTVRVVTNDIPDDEFVARHTYFPFGREATPTDQDAEPMKFTGHERDLQSSPSSTADDLDYMHARFRSPLMARFLSVDPAAPNAHAPQSWNRYCYVFSNPLIYVDPTGMAAEESFFDRVMARIKAKLDEWFPTPDTHPDPAAQALADDQELRPSQVSEFDAGGDQAGAQEGLKVATAAMGAGASSVGAELVANAAISRATRILSAGGRLIGSAGSREAVREVPGGSRAGLELFARLAKGGENVRNARYPGVMVKLGDGAFIGYRPVSRSGPATIDVNIPGVGIDKIHFIE